MTKVKIVEDKCIGCGACVSINDEVFEFNDQGLVNVKTEFNYDGSNDTVKEEVAMAIDSCPTSAIEKQ